MKDILELAREIRMVAPYDERKHFYSDNDILKLATAIRNEVLEEAKTECFAVKDRRETRYAELGGHNQLSDMWHTATVSAALACAMAVDRLKSNTDTEGKV